MKGYICIEGNIGSGKTTLAKMLSAEWQARLILEEFADNPFLQKFYVSPERYAFPLEMSFLAERYRQLKEEVVHSDLFAPQIVSDYSPMKSLIFARNNLGEREFSLYREFHEIVYQHLPVPEIIVFLHRPVKVLLEQIRKRGREYEQNIGADYLQQINNSYSTYFRQKSHLKVLSIELGADNFIENKDLFRQIQSLIISELKK